MGITAVSGSPVVRGGHTSRLELVTVGSKPQGTAQRLLSHVLEVENRVVQLLTVKRIPGVRGYPPRGTPRGVEVRQRWIRVAMAYPTMRGVLSALTARAQRAHPE